MNIYGVDGLLYQVWRWDGTSWSNVASKERIYFAGRLVMLGGNKVVTDRVGSVVRHGGVNPAYYPYGQERTTSANDQPKFGTYTRDSHSGLDYAMNRYYFSNWGRFTTPDPYRASGGAANPQSWNRYAYVEGDPVNFNDPEGLIPQRPLCYNTRLVIGGDERGLRELLSTNTELGLLALLIYGESAGPRDRVSSEYLDEKLMIGFVAVNRYQIVNGHIEITDESTGKTRKIIGWGEADGTLASILGAPGQFDVFRRQGDQVVLAPGTRNRLNSDLASDFDSEACNNILNSVFAAYTVYHMWRSRGTPGFIWTDENGVSFLPTSFHSRRSSTPSHHWEMKIPDTNFSTRNKFFGVHLGLVWWERNP